MTRHRIQPATLRSPWGAGALALVVLGCGGKLFTIDVSEQATTVIPGATLLETLAGDLGFGSFVSMNISESEELANQGVAPGDIRESYLVEFTLEATDPPGADLSWIDAMDLYVTAPDLPEVRIASLDDFPEGVSTVSFDLDDVDLTDWIVSESMTLTTDVTGRRPPEETTVTAGFVLEVGVTQQGLCNNL